MWCFAPGLGRIPSSKLDIKMDQPRIFFVYAGVFLLLVSLPLIPVMYFPEGSDQAGTVIFISYARILHKIQYKVVDNVYQIEWFTLLAVALMLSVGIFVSKIIIHQLKPKRKY